MSTSSSTNTSVGVERNLKSRLDGAQHQGTGKNGRGHSGVMGKLRRWNIMNNSEDCEPGKYSKGPSKSATMQKEATIQALKSALRKNYLFSDLEDVDIEHMIEVMSRVVKQPGDIIIRQGHKGTEFFVLEKGHADVFVNDEKVCEYGPGACFGELALIYNAKRAATITSTSTSILWSLDLRSFRRILATASISQSVAQMEFLRRIPLLKNLSNEQISKLAGALVSHKFLDGATIIRQGDPGDSFYLIKDGSVKCTQNKQGREIHLMTLSRGNYFGEMALLLDEPRHASVTAVGSVEVLSLRKQEFTRLLGPVRDVLSLQMRIRVLRSVPLLSRLSDAELDHVGNAMRVEEYQPNERIVNEGEPGNIFYIITEGVVKCCKISATNSNEEEEILQLRDQEYFGERALLKEEPRAASVVALTRVECLALERADFTCLLNDLKGIMIQEVNRREDFFQHEKQRRQSQEVVGIASETKPVYNVDSAAPSAAGEDVSQSSFKMEDLNVLRTLGTGTFGRVKLVQFVITHAMGALKCMQKAHIVACHQERNIMNEKNILSSCNHPFILKLLGTLKDADQIYMLMELVQGGELWMYIYDRFDSLPRTNFGGFLKGHTQFYAACALSALDYIHKKDVAYRDLKPENLLLDSQGYLKIIDFGFAKTVPFQKNGNLQLKTFTLCGTPEYLAPELVLSRGHDKSVDYWAFGCLVYELMVGRTPFQDEQHDEIFKKIIHSSTNLTFPRGLDNDCIDLIKGLMNPNPAVRLGNLLGGPKEIMEHPFFSGLDWSQLRRKTISAPFHPSIRDPMDVSSFEPYPDDEKVVPYKGTQSIFDKF